MHKRLIQKTLPFLFIFFIAFLITGCSLEKDMAGEKVHQSSEKIEEQVLVENKEEKDVSEKTDDTKLNEEEQEETDSSSSSQKENKRKTNRYESTGFNEQKKSHEAKQQVESNKKPQSYQSVKATSKQQPSKTTKEKQKEAEKKKSTVIFSIVISNNEVPLPPTEMEITDGETVLQALIKITKEKKIQMDYRGGQGSSAYVEGIANVYEFDRGQGSGWMYRVNGIFPDRGAGTVPLYDGDRVEWLYTTNLGKDLGANLQPFRR